MSRKQVTAMCIKKNSNLTLLHKNLCIRNSKSPRAQGGMTLIVGLVLMAMLMVISVIGFRNTTLSERMTGNVVDRNVSFQSAESAGKEALAAIEAGEFSTSTLGHYAVPFAEGGSSNFWDQGAGATISATACATTTPFSWTSCAASVGTKYASNSENAKYVIELVSAVPSGGSTVSTYRVTSRSTGGSGNAEVVLQVLYLRTTTP
jgi:type IV pilus assembly protein PilX